MQATRWTRGDSDDGDEQSDGSGFYGDESVSSDGDGTNSVSNEARDDISALVTRVLMDLEAFFDHELLCGGDDDGAASDQERDNDVNGERGGGSWGGGAISLDELSVVLNASIQRHQPVAASVVMEVQAACREKKTGMKADRRMRTKQQQQQLPFTHFQHLLEQKTQRFRAKCRNARRASRPQAQRETGHGRRQASSGWDSRRSHGSAHFGLVVSSDDERGEEMKEDHDSSSDEEEDGEDEELSDDDGDSEDSAIGSVAPSVAAATEDRTSKRVETRFGRSSSSAFLPTTTRDAITQATLMQDQGQQTSLFETQAVTKLSCSTLSAHALQEEVVYKDKEEEDDAECGDENEDPLQGRAKWSLLFRSNNSPATTPAKASAASNSMASSSDRSCSSNELNRLRRIHHLSDTRCNQTETLLREAESQTSPAKAPQPVVQAVRDHEKEKAVYHQEPFSHKVVTPLPLPHLKPQTWELDLSNFNA